MELEAEDEAELEVVEPLHLFIQVYRPVLLEVLVQLAVRLSHITLIVADMQHQPERSDQALPPVNPLDPMKENCTLITTTRSQSINNQSLISTKYLKCTNRHLLHYIVIVN